MEGKKGNNTFLFTKNDILTQAHNLDIIIDFDILIEDENYLDVIDIKT
ncbi:MAG: hypothetical protein AB8U25_03130 [Rickettsiales endosymbiont of Dermacentor nuttalli]